MHTGLSIQGKVQDMDCPAHYIGLNNNGHQAGMTTLVSKHTWQSCSSQYFVCTTGSRTVSSCTLCRTLFMRCKNGPYCKHTQDQTFGQLGASRHKQYQNFRCLLMSKHGTQVALHSYICQYTCLTVHLFRPKDNVCLQQTSVQHCSSLLNQFNSLPG